MRLFEDWDDDEWLLFDGLVIHCVQYYLKHGIKEWSSENTFRRKIKFKTSPEFYDWVVDKEWEVKRYNLHELKSEFENLGTNDLSPQKFNSHLLYSLKQMGCEVFKKPQGSNYYLHVKTLKNNGKTINKFTGDI